MSEDKARADGAWGPRWKKPISSCAGSFRRSISFRAASVSCSAIASRHDMIGHCEGPVSALLKLHMNDEPAAGRSSRS